MALDMRSQRIYIAKLNIEHYRELLARPLNEAERATITRLLAEEEAKLNALLGDQPASPAGKS